MDKKRETKVSVATLTNPLLNGEVEVGLNLVDIVGVVEVVQVGVVEVVQVVEEVGGVAEGEDHPLATNHLLDIHRTSIPTNTPRYVIN